jgi:hypothetical protein
MTRLVPAEANVLSGDLRKHCVPTSETEFQQFYELLELVDIQDDSFEDAEAKIAALVGQFPDLQQHPIGKEVVPGRRLPSAAIFPAFVLSALAIVIVGAAVFHACGYVGLVISTGLIVALSVAVGYRATGEDQKR